MTLPRQQHLLTITFILLFVLNQLILKEIVRWLIEDLSPSSWGDPLCPSSSSQHVRKGISTGASWVRSRSHHLTWVTALLSAGKSKPVRLVSLKVSTAECCTFSSNHLQLSWPSLSHCVTMNLHPGAWWPLLIQPWAKAAAWAFSRALSEG